jgi:lipopolysaccharide biosynthesis regulator YciM
MDNALQLFNLLFVIIPVAWLAWFLGWHSGYKKASDESLKRIPYTMALGWVAGRLVGPARDASANASSEVAQ